MSIKLEDYEEFLKEAAPEVRDVLESTFQEASRVMSPAGLQIYFLLTRNAIGSQRMW